jgi:serine/threonine protein kinase
MVESTIDFKFIQGLVKTYNLKTISMSEITLKEKVGEGGQAQVYLGAYGKITVAVKVITELDKKCFEQEVSALSKVNHANIPKFYGLIVEKTLAIVIDYVKGRTLDEIVSKLNNSQKVSIIKQLADVLEYMHSLGFIHRDLKPENTMIDENCNVFLIDFGIAKHINENTFDAVTRAKGTVHYLAPESLDAADYTEEEDIISIITTKVDVWSYGCIVSYLFSGHLPWSNVYNESSICQQLMMKTKFPVPNNLGNDTIVKIVTACTEVDSKKRANMKDIKAMLEKLN